MKRSGKLQHATVLLACPVRVTLSENGIGLSSSYSQSIEAISMVFRRGSVVGFACALLICTTPPRAALQTLLVAGTVKTLDGDPVAQTEVRVEGSGSDITKPSGEFKITVGPPLGPGMVATFYVSGWVIIDPYVLERGRTYLPAPEAEPIHIKVLRKKDPRLLLGDSVRRILEEKSSRFPAKPTPTGRPRSWLQREKRPVFVRGVTPSASERTVGTTRDVGLVFAAYSINTPVHPAEPVQDELRDAAAPEDDEFLEQQAKELGFTEDQLKAAIDRWVKTANDPYDKGLAALYEHRYREASYYLTEGIAYSPGAFYERYVPLARAEFEQAHYAAAEFALRNPLAVHGDDPIILNDLQIVTLKAKVYTELLQCSTAEACLIYAWEAFKRRDYGTAIHYATDCIVQFHRTADKEEDRLESASIPLPPTGKVSHEEKEKVLTREPLNEVAAAYYVKGRSAEYLYLAAKGPERVDYRDAAIEAYRAACHYRYGRALDADGSFLWSPCEASSDGLERLGKEPSRPDRRFR